MNDPLSPLRSEPDLSHELASLRSMLQITLVATLIATTSVAVFLLWQHRQVRRELANQAATMAQLQEQQKGMNLIADKFRQYGAKDRNFLPILTKVGLQPADALPTAPAPTNSATPKPKL